MKLAMGGCRQRGRLAACFLALGLTLAPSHARAAEAVLFICQDHGRAVYTSYPDKLPHRRCQPSALHTEAGVDVLAQEDPVSRWWYDRRFGHFNPDTPILPPSPPKPRPPVAVAAVAAAPPKASAAALIRRDMAAESAALAVLEQQLKNSLQTGAAAQAQNLKRQIEDRHNNLRALKNEWRQRQ